MAREAILGWVSADLEALPRGLSRPAAVSGVRLARDRHRLPKRSPPARCPGDDSQRTALLPNSCRWGKRAGMNQALHTDGRTLEIHECEIRARVTCSWSRIASRCRASERSSSCRLRAKHCGDLSGQVVQLVGQGFGECDLTELRPLLGRQEIGACEQQQRGDLCKVGFV
jgi:hypothetical protein